MEQRYEVKGCYFIPDDADWDVAMTKGEAARYEIQSYGRFEPYGIINLTKKRFGGGTVIEWSYFETLRHNLRINAFGNFDLTVVCDTCLFQKIFGADPTLDEIILAAEQHEKEVNAS